MNEDKSKDPENNADPAPVHRVVSRPVPAGFVATCRCGVITGAMDFESTGRRDAGKIIGEWLCNGCTIEPRFNHNWSVLVQACKCGG
jgi:hypothetical protein